LMEIDFFACWTLGSRYSKLYLGTSEYQFGSPVGLCF
jgi:hypothetical protein